MPVSIEKQTNSNINKSDAFCQVFAAQRVSCALLPDVTGCFYTSLAL